MTADATSLLDELRARGVTLVVADGALRFRPASAVGPDLRDRLARHKCELIALLTGTSSDPIGAAQAAAALLATVADPDERAGLWDVFEDRAAFYEFCCDQPQPEAERMALRDLQDDLSRREGVRGA